jgi:hypothetical protein
VAAVAPPKIRLGIVADSALQPRWIADALAKAASTGFVDVAVLSCEDRGQAPASIPSLLWSSYSRLDRAAFMHGDDWSHPTDIARLVPPSRRQSITSYDGADLDVIFAIEA